MGEEHYIANTIRMRGFVGAAPPARGTAPAPHLSEEHYSYFQKIFDSDSILAGRLSICVLGKRQSAADETISYSKRTD